MTNTCGHFRTFGRSTTCEGCGRSLNLKARVYVGPTLVSVAASRLRDAGFVVTCEGTEAVYFLGFDATVEQAVAALGMSGVTLRDVQELTL